MERRADLTKRDGLVAASLLLVILITGLSPGILLALQEHSVHALSQRELGAIAEHR